MSGSSTYVPKTALGRWIESRLPIGDFIYSSFVDYPTPKNLNYWWTFGAILSFMLVAQIMTGLVMAMHYDPSAAEAANSIENMVRNVQFGNILRSAHANGASMFFLAVYIHIARGLYYGSYKSPREILWLLGLAIFFLMMGTGFMGYVLPWGQMSYYGAKVITSLVTAIPFVGESIKIWLWGGFSVDNATLNRFFVLHFLLPFVICGVVGLHVWALHVVGQNNPTGVEVKDVKKDCVPFTPYATMKDAFGIAAFCVLYAWFIFFVPDYLGHPDNYVPANPMATPAHIVPEWYFLPYYAILRSIPNLVLGVIAMFMSLALLGVLPWLDRSRVRSATYRPMFRFFFWTFIICVVLLGYLGSQPPEGLAVIASQVLTGYYFAFFLVIVPLLGFIEKPKPLPASIADSVLENHASTAA